eukprot:TRINITY_DN21_c0_g1_i1.p1 TRINITY_DN21_c0_g1~~TRINITY_DN21_c0_g1_i1.p1  ORF type:complete len:301 (+),score=48.24 TRINITY_DN21_c0_g1_i1:94-996(+)
MSQRELSDPSPDETNPIITALKDITAGSVGGVFQSLVGHPFDTVKVRLQTTSQYSGMINCFSTTIKEEGIFGLYKGVQSPLLGLAALNAVLFMSYGQGKEIVRPKGESLEKRLTVPRYFLAGGIAGFFSAFVEGPFDFLKCQLQVRYKEFNGFFDCAGKIIRGYGLKGLFQGFGATQLRNIPCNAFYFGGYEWSKNLLASPGQRVEDLEFWKLLAAGGFAGISYWGFAYPLDVVKSTIQADSANPQHKKYKGIIDTTRTIYKEKGVQGFFKGYTPCIVRSVPANAVCFFGYEIAKNFMNR